MTCLQEKHSAINSAETPLICNTTLTCSMLRRWTAPLPQNNITKLLLDEEAFEAELDFNSRQNGQSEGDFTVFNPMPFVNTRVRQKWLPQSRLQK